MLLVSSLLFTQVFQKDNNTYCYGDSIAVGYCKNFLGKRKVGSNPAQVLTYLQNDTLKFKGKNIIISTGISNNRTDTISIEKQFELLKRTANTVIVIGAARGRYDKENLILAILSQKYGFKFTGGFNPSKDKVHPMTYNTLP
jgi:hypothetical protein